MTQSWSSWYWKLGLAGSLVSVGAITSTNSAFAQLSLTPDTAPERSLGTAVVPLTPETYLVTGGTRPQNGPNLFHSFLEFNVLEKRGAYFDNPAGVTNILSRVTGSDPSDILGTLGVSGGDANLFLINPMGIIFGPKASLDVNSSFVATTANAIQFGNQGSFSASAPNTLPVLTVNPSALLFNQIAAGSITNYSRAPAGQRLDPLAQSGVRDLYGLRVPDGQSLLLVGGNVSLDGGGVNALGGQIELGSVAGAGTVGLDVDGKNLRLSFPDSVARADVSLVNGAEVNTSGEGGGDIYVQGRRVLVNSGSQISAATFGKGRAGNLRVSASESVELTGFIPLGNLSTATFGDGDAGDLTITTGKLIVRDGAQVFTFTAGKGSGGQLTVTASESLELIGTSQDGFTSGLFSTAVATGAAGDIAITTKKLIVRDGAVIATQSAGANSGTFIPAEGTGGDLTVIAADSVQLFSTSPSGVNGGLTTGTSGTAPAGNLTITTGSLLVRDGTQVSVGSESTGSAGTLTVVAPFILLDNQGTLTATTNSGEGGNITINTDTLVGLENSDITANAFEGEGGFIQITAQGIFGLEVREELTENSDITAFSQADPSLNGVVEINTPDVDPDDQVVNLPEKVVDLSGLVAQSCPAGGRAVARESSEFVVTGRGGVPPTPGEALKSDSALVDLGTPIVSSTEPPPAPESLSPVDSVHATPEKPLSYVGNRTKNHANSAVFSNLANFPPAVITEAQGWIMGPKGEVVLTAQTPIVTPHGSGLTSAACDGS